MTVRGRCAAPVTGEPTIFAVWRDVEKLEAERVCQVGDALVVRIDSWDVVERSSWHEVQRVAAGWDDRQELDCGVVAQVVCAPVNKGPYGARAPESAGKWPLSFTLWFKAATAASVFFPQQPPRRR